MWEEQAWAENTQLQQYIFQWNLDKIEDTLLTKWLNVVVPPWTNWQKTRLPPFM